MLTVQRHVLAFSKWGKAEVHTTKGARPFSIKQILGEWVLWSLADGEARPATLHLYMVETGQSLPVLRTVEPINTICLPNGRECHFFVGTPLGPEKTASHKSSPA